MTQRDMGPPAQTTSDPSEAWRALLEHPGGYEHHCSSQEEFNRLRKLGFAWTRVLKIAKLLPGDRAFEVGCGGGKHLALLAAHGFEVHGVDVSPAVAARARNYLASVARFAPIRASVEEANFLEYDVLPRAASFAMSFHAGVVEHFLEPAQRAQIWKKMVALVRPGGWVVSMVPGGKHVLRERIRRERLAGYDVPEIDYGCELHTHEFQAAGLTDIVCMAHNFFSFLPAHQSKLLSGPLSMPTRLLSNATLPWLPVPETWKERFAGTLIVVGRKR
jgi:SAM-dependent methyltransferase